MDMNQIIAQRLVAKRRRLTEDSIKFPSSYSNRDIMDIIDNLGYGGAVEIDGNVVSGDEVTIRQLMNELDLDESVDKEFPLGSKSVSESRNSANKLTSEELMKYPYKFNKVWKSSINSTYADDFLELAEEHNCLLVRNDSYRINFFICKNRSDYEALKNALKSNKVLSSYFDLTSLQEIDWGNIINKVPSIYVDRYVGGYSVKFLRKRR